MAKLPGLVRVSQNALPRRSFSPPSGRVNKEPFSVRFHYEFTDSDFEPLAHSDIRHTGLLPAMAPPMVCWR